MFNIGDKVRPNILVSCDHGLMILNRFDNNPVVGIGGFLLDHGNNSTVEAQYTAQFIEQVENPIVIDVGANIGTYATWVARFVENRNGRVYCFEPQRSIYQILCGNMAINNIHNVYAYNIGLGNEDKFIDIQEADYFKEHSSFGAYSLDGIDRKKYQNSDKVDRIRLSKLDTFMSEYNVPKVDFIKIDAEGLDIDVIRGGYETIMKYKPDLYVEYLNLGSSKDEDTSEEGKQNLIQVCQSLGYNTYVVGHDILATTKVLEK